MRILIRVWAILISAVLCLGGASVAPASAASVVSRDFSVTKKFYSPDLKRCLWFTVSGTLESRAFIVARNGGQKIYHLQGLTVADPRLVVDVRKVKRGCGSTTHAKLSGISFEQNYYASECTANVSGGVSVSGGGLSLGISVTPHCGDVLLASRASDRTGTKSDSYRQSNSGTEVKWAYADSASTTSSNVAICIDPMVQFRAYIGSKDDGGTLSLPTACVRYPK